MAKVRGVQKARQIDIRSATKEQLRMYISQEGKRLNWQLAELEKRGLEKSSFAYQNLISRASNLPFLGQSKSGFTKIKLSTRGMTRQQMEGIASVIQKTVNAETITPSGITNYYGRVFEGLRRRYPEFNNFTDEQMADIFVTTGMEASKKSLTSDRLMQMISQSSDVSKIKSYMENANRFETVIQAERAYRKLMGNKNFVYTKTSPFDSEGQL